jgi:hypothetical protein
VPHSLLVPFLYLKLSQHGCSHLSLLLLIVIWER